MCHRICLFGERYAATAFRATPPPSSTLALLTPHKTRHRNRAKPVQPRFCGPPALRRRIAAAAHSFAPEALAFVAGIAGSPRCDRLLLLLLLSVRLLSGERSPTDKCCASSDARWPAIQSGRTFDTRKVEKMLRRRTSFKSLQKLSKRPQNSRAATGRIPRSPRRSRARRMRGCPRRRSTPPCPGVEPTKLLARAWRSWCTKLCGNQNFTERSC